MKLKNFFLNCLNRRSFQFLNFVGLSIISLPITFWLFYSKLIYTGDNIYIDIEPAFFMIILLLLPTLGLLTNLSVIAIYLKLLHREYTNPEYRLKNKFLTQNPIYGFLAFIFYIFAIVSIASLLYLASANLEIYTENVFHAPIYLYPFIIYTLIHILIIKKI